METDRIIAREMELAERIFGTATDPDQIPVTEASRRKLLALSPEAIQHELDADGEPIAWVVVIPTTKPLMEEFLAGRITERELFDRTEPQERYDALYLCSAITLPEHRRRGIAVKLFKRAVERIPHTHDAALFAWPTTPEGRALTEGLQDRFGSVVRLRR